MGASSSSSPTARPLPLPPPAKKRRKRGAHGLARDLCHGTGPQRSRLAVVVRGPLDLLHALPLPPDLLRALLLSSLRSNLLSWSGRRSRPASSARRGRRRALAGRARTTPRSPVPGLGAGRSTRRFASWREATLICVLVRLVRKKGALFASSVGACFFQLKHCGGRILRLRRVLPTLLEAVLVS